MGLLTAPCLPGALLLIRTKGGNDINTLSKVQRDTELKTAEEELPSNPRYAITQSSYYRRKIELSDLISGIK